MSLHSPPLSAPSINKRTPELQLPGPVSLGLKLLLLAEGMGESRVVSDFALTSQGLCTPSLCTCTSQTCWASRGRLPGTSSAAHWDGNPLGSPRRDHGKTWKRPGENRPSQHQERGWGSKHHSAESRDLSHGTVTVETDFWLNHGPQTQEKLEPKELQTPSGFLCSQKIIDGPLSFKAHFNVNSWVPPKVSALSLFKYRTKNILHTCELSAVGQE